GVGTDGQIDFKDRGRIPQVEKEMVLVEKTPMIESIPGKNIYGEIISVKPSVDCEIKIGKGVELSMNGLQASAAVQGYPEISSTGEVCVLDIYILEGDVDYETGHVEHEGDIEIRGCIKSGFKVKGHNIKANAIDDGIIEAKGNLEILNGINSGKIHVTGDVSAKFIHKSDITCAGEVSVAKEIIDAVIKNRGKCSMANGKIISSDISSKMGVFVKDIGTEKGIPSNIRVGFDMFSEKELQINQISLEDYNKTLVEMVNDQEKKTDEKEKFTKRIDEYTQIKSDLQISHQNIISKIESLKKSGNALDSPEAIKEKTDKLQAEMKQVVDKLEFYVGSKNELEKQIKALTQKIGKHKLKIKNIEFERESILKWIEDNPGKTVVTASGIIMEKTIIHGLNSRKVLDEEVRNVKLNETRDTKPGAGPNAYKIEIFH
ncbi:MAG: DUF342 domain-containing protein, partial [Desulfobacteraceae bacterium]|nr:DUF342 domain-containing protein [Desulfobacteraceae bacterium]